MQFSTSVQNRHAALLVIRQSMELITGSCLCGEINYQLSGSLGAIGHCHCHMCQKAHGAAFATYINVVAEEFKFTKGENLLSVFKSSGDVERTFCSLCGSNLQFRKIGKARFGITAGTLDCRVSRVPDFEIWTTSSQPWSATADIPLSHKETHSEEGDA